MKVQNARPMRLFMLSFPKSTRTEKLQRLLGFGCAPIFLSFPLPRTRKNRFFFQNLKSYNHLIPLPKLRNKMVVSNLSGGGVQETKSSLQPCLLITDTLNCRIQTNMFNNKPQLLYDVGGEIPEFLGRRIVCSFGEWVLLTCSFGRRHKLPEVLVNLLSKEIIELPVLGITYNFCILTSHPYDPTCHIVYFSKEKKALIFCQPGDKEFTIKKWDYKFFPSGGGAFVAGKLFLDLREPTSVSVLGVIEFKESTYRFEVIKMDRGIRSITMEKSLIFEYSGELFTVNKIRWGTSPLSGMEILKADFFNKKWVSVKSLGTNAIFIGCCGYGTAAHVQCASVESGIKANSIYFLETFELDHYYHYNLEEGTIRMKPTEAFSSLEMETTIDPRLNWIMLPRDASFPKLLKGDQESICHDSEKEKKRKREEVGVRNSWNMVPPELLNLIQLHLFGRDNAVFRVVCKAWQQVSIQDYSIPSIPLLLSSTTLIEELCQSSSPLLMFQEDLTISCDTVPIFRFFDPVHRKLYRTGIPELRETDIHCSKDGWLLVSRHSDKSIFFFNPLTQEKIKLPRLPLLDSFFSAKAYSLSFSSLPTSLDCLVVGAVHYVMFYTLKHGEETWREQGMGEFGGQYECCPVVLNGLHHFMRSRNRDMIVFNFKDDGVEGQFPYCQTWSTNFKRLKCHLDDFFLEIDGALAFVRVNLDGGEMSIFKWNELETDWELMEGGVGFGGKEMFLSRKGSFLEKIDDGVGMGNTIFLPMIDHDAKEGVFYSLATHRYHTLYSGYSSELPYNADNFLNGIWVKPDRKIVGDSNLNWFM